MLKKMHSSPAKSWKAVADHHHFKILQGLDDLRQHEVLCDVVLKVDRVCIPAHRAVLASFSSYFKTMFTSGWQECNRKDVQMHGVDGEAVKSLVDYAYRGVLDITEDNVEDLFSAANLLELPAALELCGAFLLQHLHPSNCIGFAVMADRYRCKELREQSQKFICDHFHDVFIEDEFLSLSRHDLVSILTCDDLCVVNTEETIYEALKFWVKHDPREREELLEELLLKCFRWELASTELLQKLKSTSNLTKCKEAIARAISCRESCDIEESSKQSESYRLRQPSEALCVIGGQNSRFPSLEDAEELITEDSGWTEFPPVPECRINSSAVALNGNLYVLGGRVSHVQLDGLVNGLVSHDHSNEVLRCTLGRNVKENDNVWTAVTPMLKKRCSMGVTVYQGKIYAIGGFDGENHLRLVCRKVNSCFSH